MMKAMHKLSPETKQMIVFYVLAFTISWLIWSPLVFISSMKDFAFLIFIGAYGPLIAGMITVRLFNGPAALKPWLKTIFKLRVGLRWHLTGIFVFPLLIAFSHLALYLALGGNVQLSTDPPWYWAVSVFPVNVVLVVPFSSAFEEAGWQGFALPKLNSVFRPPLANLIHGFLWAGWHLPLFFASAWGGKEPVGLLFAYTVPLSMIMVWLTRKSSGSTIPAIFLHQATNHYGGLFTSTAIFAGTLAAGFTVLKTVIYWGIAFVLLAATKGQLGYDATAVPPSGEVLAVQKDPV